MFPDSRFILDNFSLPDMLSGWPFPAIEVLVTAYSGASVVVFDHLPLKRQEYPKDKRALRQAPEYELFSQ